MTSFNRIKLSVIVPMYNTEPYLRECIDSLLAQTLEDMEIVLVDDGSPDACGFIADSYAFKHSNIKSIHKKNGGLGTARNTGIAAAEGEYVGFVDSDDWAHSWMFESLYRTAKCNDADIVVGGHEEWTDKKLVKRERHPLSEQVLKDAAAISALRKTLYGREPGDAHTSPHPVSVCFSIYRKSMLTAGKILFHEVLSEDVFFNLDAYRIAKTIAVVEDCGYCYRKDCQDSITRTLTPEKSERHAAFFELLAHYASDEDDSASCLSRARRKMIDYARSYVFMVERSNLSIDEKITEVKKLTTKEAFNRFCANYPTGMLPPFQSLFHRLLVTEHVGTALVLTRMRMLTRGER